MGRCVGHAAMQSGAAHKQHVIKGSLKGSCRGLRRIALTAQTSAMIWLQLTRQDADLRA